MLIELPGGLGRFVPPFIIDRLSFIVYLPRSAMGLFARLKQGLTKTTQLLRTDIRDLFKSGGRLVDDQFLEELRRILVSTDMGPQAAKENIDEIATQFRARVIEMSDAISVVKAKLKEL